MGPAQSSKGDGIVSDNTAIEWSDASWNPVLGCARVSPGCDACYAIVQARIRAGNPNPKVATAFEGLTKPTEGRADWTGRINLLPERLEQPLRWRKPRKIFVNSLADLFHEDVPDQFIADVFAVMAVARWHTFQLLSKRHGRMKALLTSDSFRAMYEAAWDRRASDLWRFGSQKTQDFMDGQISAPWPIPNLCLGVSIENQPWAEIRVHALLSCQQAAGVLWVSAEPLLGPIDLRNLKARNGALIDALCGDVKSPDGTIYAACPGSVSWVVAGGESGAGSRPMHPDWARSLRDQCQDARVPYLFKQWGSHRWVEHSAYDDATQCWVADGIEPQRVSKKLAGRELDGREWNEYPRVYGPVPA
jgi:protein gp37